MVGPLPALSSPSAEWHDRFMDLVAASQAYQRPAYYIAELSGPLQATIPCS